MSEIDRAHRHLGDLTLGLVGLGAIGREIARRAAAFGMQILAVDPDTEQRIDPVRRLMPPDRLDEMLPECDYVVIAAPHTPATEKMFRTPQFERMRETACLINIGRGAIVDLAELTEALQRGEIGGAALDVFEIEPLPQDHPLWDMPNVIITPHVAGASPRIAERHLEVLKDNVDRFVRGQPLRNIADKANWY